MRFVTEVRKIHHRRPVKDPIQAAKNAAAALTKEERDSIIAPSLKHIADATTRGLTKDAYLYLGTAMHVGLAIEDAGVVKGLKAEFEDALALLDVLHDKCSRGQNWKVRRIDPGEAQRLKEAIELHDFQLQQLSHREFQTCVRKITNQTTDRINKQKKSAQ